MNRQQQSWFKLVLRVMTFAKPFKKPLTVVFLCVLSTTIVSAMNFFCWSKIIDILQKHLIEIQSYKNQYGFWQSVLYNAHFKQIVFWSLVSILAVLLRIKIVGIQNRTEVKDLDIMIPNYLGQKSIIKYFSFSNGQHINEHSGVRQNVVNNGTVSIQNQINLMIVQLFPALAGLFVALIVLFYAQWIIGVIYTIIAIIFCWMMYHHNNKLLPGTRQLRERRQLNSRLFSEFYRLVTLVKNENREEKSLEEIRTAQQKHQDIYTETWGPGMARIQKIRSVSNTLNYLTRLLSLCLIVFTNEVTFGAFFLILSYSDAMINSLWQLTGIHKQFLMDRINIEKYFELMDIKPDIVIEKNPIRPEKLLGHIKVDKLTFYYPKRVSSYETFEESADQDEPVLRDISFTINPGEKLGIVGGSGSGKSTFTQLLLRNFDPQKGQILIDGNDLRLLDPSWYLQNVGIVQQEVDMLDRSIRENILFGLNGKAKDISEDRLQELAEMSLIDGLIKSSEHGFDTIVGERGMKLSGGEIQRIGIARALAKDPSILIFDEATSDLDTISEKIVQSSIDKASNGKTTIIIAHRLSTVMNCDRILVLRNGTLIAQGKHEELIETCEYYAELVNQQSLV